MISTARVCQREGCMRPLSGAHGNARYCCGACRSAAYRARTGYRLVAVRNAPQTRKSRRGRTSGAQIPWRKANIELTNWLVRQGWSYADAHWQAEAILGHALPEKQRQRVQPIPF